jgi:hypothetical protein
VEYGILKVLTIFVEISNKNSSEEISKFLTNFFPSLNSIENIKNGWKSSVKKRNFLLVLLTAI